MVKYYINVLKLYINYNKNLDHITDFTIPQNISNNNVERFFKERKKIKTNDK